MEVDEQDLDVISLLSVAQHPRDKKLRLCLNQSRYLKKESKGRRLLVMVDLMFFLIKRFSNIRESRWELVESLENGDVRVLQPKSKTDQEGVGVEWHIPAGRQGVVGPAELTDW